MADDLDEDQEIKEMQAKLLEMEAEAAKLANDDEEEGLAEGTNADGEGGDGENGEDDVSEREIYVGNLAPDVTPETLNNFFSSCGTVNRITVLCDQYTGAPKGFAYMEFAEKEAIELALGLNETEMNGKQIKVTRKRKNVPRHVLNRGRGRGRGGRGGFRGRGGGGGYRGRGRGAPRGRYNPY